jgi:hypothetical protein
LANSLHAFLVNNAFRKTDEVRRWKSAIADLTKEPFWDSDRYGEFEMGDFISSWQAKYCSMSIPRPIKPRFMPTRKVNNEEKAP